MARPKPNVILTHSQADGTTWQVLAAPKIYILTYQGQAFNLCTESIMDSQPRKYKKTAYANEGSARARARELNQLFMTEDFSYYQQGIDQ